MSDTPLKPESGEEIAVPNDSLSTPTAPQPDGDLPALSNISPITGNPKRKGGPDTHKPGCICRPCKARRRKEEAVDGGAGTEHVPDIHGYMSKSVLEANLPPIVTKSRSARARIADWALIRANEPGITDKEVAARLGIAPATLKTLIANATRDGWLKFDDPMERLEHELMPKAADNMKYFLDKKDRQVTLALFNGAMVPKWKEAQGIQEAATTVLAIKIEPAPLQQLPGAPDIKVVTGTIVGKPKMLE